MEESGQCLGIHLFVGFKVKNPPLPRWFFGFRCPVSAQKTNVLFVTPSVLLGHTHGCFLSVSFGDKAGQIS